MIYLIDEKIERQKSYGWDTDRFELYQSELKRIIDYDGLKLISSNTIFQEGNIILLHDSFFKNLKISEKDAEKFKDKIRVSKCLKCFVFFGGSYDSTYINNGNLEIKDDIFYSNLESFFKSENKIVNILAYGKNFKYEEFCNLKNHIWTYLFMFKDEEFLSKEAKFDILKISNYNERISEIFERNNSVLFLKTELSK